MERIDFITDGRLTDLEIKVSYLEDFLEKIQNVVVEQSELLDRVFAENRLMREKIKEMSDQLEGDIPNVRPPHY